MYNYFLETIQYFYVCLLLNKDTYNNELQQQQNTLNKKQKKEEEEKKKYPDVGLLPVLEAVPPIAQYHQSFAFAVGF